MIILGRSGNPHSTRLGSTDNECTDRSNTRNQKPTLCEIRAEGEINTTTSVCNTGLHNGSTETNCGLILIQMVFLPGRQRIVRARQDFSGPEFPPPGAPTSPPVSPCHPTRRFPTQHYRGFSILPGVPVACGCSCDRSVPHTQQVLLPELATYLSCIRTLSLPRPGSTCQEPVKTSVGDVEQRFNRVLLTTLPSVTGRIVVRVTPQSLRTD